jgi:hypothetical protein
MLAAGTIVGALAGKGYAGDKSGQPVDTSKILNYHPQMN